MAQLAHTEWWELLPREPRTSRLSLKANRRFSIPMCGHRYDSCWCGSIIFLWLKKTSSRLFISFEKCSHPARVLADFNARHPRDVSNQVCFRARCEEKIQIFISILSLSQTFHTCIIITNMSSNLIGTMVLWKCLEWASHVFHKSCPSGSRHRPHLAKVQRSRSQEQIGPRWQKVQREATTSWSM